MSRQRRRRRALNAAQSQQAAMVRWFGGRCRSFAFGCGCCEAWNLYDHTTRMPTDDEVLRVSLSRSDELMDLPDQPWGSM